MNTKLKSFLKKLTRFKSPIPIHPFLFAIYPIVFIFSNNMDELFLSQIISLILLSLITTTIVYFSLKILLRDNYKAAILTSIALIIFFSYGHIFSAVEGDKVFGFQFGRNRVLLPLSSLIFVSLLLTLKLVRFNLKKTSRFLNLIIVSLLLISVIRIGVFAVTDSLKLFEKNGQQLEQYPITNSSVDLPDTYYIILDGYARESTLKFTHNYDNSEFINYLEKKGFYVADKSQSNYSLTLLSLSSSLNMKYIDKLVEKSVSESQKRDEAIELIRNNEISRFLKSKGYKFINIGTGWGATDKNPYADEVHHFRQRSELTKLIYETTLLIALERFQLGDADSILFAFEKLREIPDVDEPTFTFAHIISPHPPYLFDKEGNKRQNYHKGFDTPEAWEERDKYVDQLIFINTKTMEAVEQILSKSKNDPIIIIQGDHGTGSLGSTPLDEIADETFNERLDILNSYYLPGKGREILYETITPVNSFRVILNYYFEENYKQLEDKSYYSQYRNYFELIEAPSE